MAKKFRMILWGLLLVVLDFKINQSDVLPDSLGYILMAIGCAGASGASRQFLWAACVAWGLFVISLIGGVLTGKASTLFAIVIIGLDCAMVWMLLGGIKDVALDKRREDLVQRSEDCRIAYVITDVLAILVVLFPLGESVNGVALVILLVVSLLVGCLIFDLIHRAQRELAD